MIIRFTACSSVRIDLLITDVGLPGAQSGLQMVETARRADLKVLCITGYPLTVASHVNGLETNLQMLMKPFTLEILVSRIKAMIEKS